MRCLFLLLAFSLLAACAATPDPRDLNATPQPAAPQPDPAALKDGLDSRYYVKAFHDIDELLEWTEYRDGIPGTPVAGLEHRAGKGEVLTSGYSDEVGAELTGYLRLPEAGSYQLQVTTNDGTRIYLGGARIHDDPKVAPDRTMKSEAFEIAVPGWYPLAVWYFERHNTSTLEVLWKTPASADFQSIPLDNLKHGG